MGVIIILTTVLSNTFVCVCVCGGGGDYVQTSSRLIKNSILFLYNVVCSSVIE
jgi:hypothetical protein